MYNPYLQFQNIPNYQMNQMNQMPRIAGRMVNDVSEVMANEVPMDGNVALFPKHDLSEICLKRWNPDGTIATIHYSPVQSSNNVVGTNYTLDDIRAKMGEFEAKISDIESRLPRKKEDKA